MSQVSLGRPEFVPGTPPGHPTAKFLYHQHQNFCNTKNFLRGINFVKITKNIFQSTRLPEERMGVTEKIGGRNEFP